MGRSKILKRWVQEHQWCYRGGCTPHCQSSPPPGVSSPCHGTIIWGLFKVHESGKTLLLPPHPQLPTPVCAQWQLVYLLFLAQEGVGEIYLLPLLLSWPLLPCSRCSSDKQLLREPGSAEDSSRSRRVPQPYTYSQDDREHPGETRQIGGTCLLLPLAPAEPDALCSLAGAGQEKLWSSPNTQASWGQQLQQAEEREMRGGYMMLSTKGKGKGTKSCGVWIITCFGDLKSPVAAPALWSERAVQPWYCMHSRSAPVGSSFCIQTKCIS